MQGEAAAKLDFAIQLAKSRLTKGKQRSYGRRFGSIEGFGAWRCHRYHHKYQAVTATWRSGYASVCKTEYSGSIPDVASICNLLICNNYLKFRDSARAALCGAGTNAHPVD